MKQCDLDKSVARATGESVRFIQRIGFQLLVLPVRNLNSKEPGVQILPSLTRKKGASPVNQHFNQVN